MRVPTRPFAGAVAALALAGLAACDRQSEGHSAAPDPSTQVIGVPAAAPTGDPPGTTPVTPQKAGGVDPKQASPEEKPQ